MGRSYLRPPWHHQRRFHPGDEGPKQHSYTMISAYLAKLGLVGAIVQEPTIFFTKISLLLLYCCLFSPDKWTKIAIFVGAAVIFSAYTLMMFLYIFLPYQDQLLVIEAVGAFNVVSDVYLLCLPIAVVSRLQLPWRKKLGVSAIFLTGLL